MSWTVLEHPAFSVELEEMEQGVVDKLTEAAIVLASTGPNLGRPYVDTLSDSGYPNMKEIRFSHNGVWRFAFAFDPDRQAVILVGGNKQEPTRGILQGPDQDRG